AAREATARSIPCGATVATTRYASPALSIANVTVFASHLIQSTESAVASASASMRCAATGVVTRIGVGSAWATRAVTANRSEIMPACIATPGPGTDGDGLRPVAARRGHRNTALSR